MDIRVNYDCSEIHKARDKLIEKKVLRMKLCCEIWRGCVPEMGVVPMKNDLTPWLP